MFQLTKNQWMIAGLVSGGLALAALAYLAFKSRRLAANLLEVDNRLLGVNDNICSLESRLLSVERRGSRFEDTVVNEPPPKRARAATPVRQEFQNPAPPHPAFNPASLFAMFQSVGAPEFGSAQVFESAQVEEDVESPFDSDELDKILVEDLSPPAVLLID